MREATKAIRERIEATVKDCRITEEKIRRFARDGDWREWQHELRLRREIYAHLGRYTQACIQAGVAYTKFDYRP